MSSYTKLTKAQLIQRVQQLEPMLEMLPAIVYLYAIREQRLIYLNRDLDAMLGDVPRSREAYQLDDLLARVHPDDMPRVRAHMQKMQRVSDDAYAEIEYRVRRQDESWMWIAARERVFERDADGQPVILFAVCQDISAYKDTESVLRARETRLKSFLDAAPDAMFVVDAQGKVLLANSQTEILFGYTQAELTGMSIDLLIPPDLRARHDTMFREYLASPERVSTLRANINALRRDGTTVPVAISLSRQTTD